MFKHHRKISILFILTILSQPIRADYDQQRPDDVTEKQWSSLQTAIQEAKLLPTPAGMGGQRSLFGQTVVIDGNRALIGAPVMFNTGVVYVVEFDGEGWTKTATLIPSDNDSVVLFGKSLTLSGDRAIIGAPNHDVRGPNSGAVYVFDFDGNQWQETALLAPDDAFASDNFGWSVSLQGERALIGALKNIHQGIRSGSAYVFEFDGNQWQESSKLLHSDRASDDDFGYAVSLSGDRALIGARLHDAQDNDAGAAYIFDFDGNNWIETAQLTASDGAASDNFGSDLSLLGGRALIGSYNDDDQGTGSGSAYVFDFDGNLWNESVKLTASGGAAGDSFGQSLSLAPDRALISAYLNDNQGINSGVAYVFDFDGTNWQETIQFSASDGTSHDWFGNRLLVGAYGDDDFGNNSGSAYFFELDSNVWVQNSKVVGNDGAANDQFGFALSVSGDRALVGAYQDSDFGYQSGSVYVFEYNGFNWDRTAKLTASDASSDQWFGYAVSLQGDQALIGAARDDEMIYNSGAAYVFEFDGSYWTETAKLMAADAAHADNLGSAVSLSGNRALVGAHLNDDQGSNSGSAYLYEYDGVSWQEMIKLLPSDGAADDRFARSVSLSGDTAMIGAAQHDSQGADSGAVYVFEFDGLNWSETTQLVPFDVAAGDWFGVSVSIFGNKALIGANRDDDHGSSSGAAYVYEHNGNSWNEAAKLTASDAAQGDAFGHSVSLSESRALVGARSDDNQANASGSAYVFLFNGNNWNETDKLTAPDGSEFDWFGGTVSIAGTRALVGATGDDEHGTNSGSAYLFALSDTFPVGGTVTGLAVDNTVTLVLNSGVQYLVIGGDGSFEFEHALADGSTFVVEVHNQPTTPNQTCTIVNGQGTLSGTGYSDIAINCTINQYSIGGYVANLIPDNQLVLQNNGNDDLVINETGTFVFPTPLDDQQNYTVTIQNQPTDPIQTCEVINANGQLSGHHVDNVLINCDFGNDLIFRHDFDSPNGISQEAWQPEI